MSEPDEMRRGTILHADLGAFYASVGPPKLKAELQEQIGKATVEAIKLPDVSVAMADEKLRAT